MALAQSFSSFRTNLKDPIFTDRPRSWFGINLPRSFDFTAAAVVFVFLPPSLSATSVKAAQDKLERYASPRKLCIFVESGSV